MQGREEEQNELNASLVIIKKYSSYVLFLKIRKAITLRLVSMADFSPNISRSFPPSNPDSLNY